MPADKQLAKARKEVELQKRLKRRVQQLKKDLRQRRTRFRRLTSTMRKAEKDVADLKGLSLKRLWVSVFKDREQSLKKEKEEYLRLREARKEVEQEAAAIKSELDKTAARLKRLGDAPGRYKRLLAKKERGLGMGPVGKELWKIAEDIGRMEAYQTEVEEAITACERVRSGLTHLIKILRNAQTARSSYYSRGEYYSTPYPRLQWIDRAKSLARRVRVYLRRLDKELKDLGMRFKAKLHFERLDPMIEVLFDGLFIEMVSDRKSARSQKHAHSILLKVRKVHRRLLSEKKSWTKELEDLRGRRRRLIESA